ncbi:MAG: hypothetical protein K6U03_02920 [Firmicutes bacterium]|nr:hypothetical protein [Bacillota bacterium]
MEKGRRTIRYGGHRKQRLFDRRGDLARRMAGRPVRRAISSPARLLWRLGGEMARRMVEAALAYLTERAVAETRAAFIETAFGGRKEDRTGDGPKA